MNTNEFSWTKVAKQALAKKAVRHMVSRSDGQFALVTPCRDHIDLSYWATREAAEKFQ